MNFVTWTIPLILLFPCCSCIKVEYIFAVARCEAYCMSEFGRKYIIPRDLNPWCSSKKCDKCIDVCRSDIIMESKSDCNNLCYGTLFSFSSKKVCNKACTFLRSTIASGSKVGFECPNATSWSIEKMRCNSDWQCPLSERCCLGAQVIKDSETNTFFLT